MTKPRYRIYADGRVELVAGSVEIAPVDARDRRHAETLPRVVGLDPAAGRGRDESPGANSRESAPEALTGVSSPQLPAASHTGVAGSLMPEIPPFLDRRDGSAIARLLALPSTMRTGALS